MPLLDPQSTGHQKGQRDRSEMQSKAVREATPWLEDVRWKVLDANPSAGKKKIFLVKSLLYLNNHLAVGLNSKQMKVRRMY